MGHETSPVKAPAQHLQCTDPWVVLQYNTLLHECLTASSVFNRAQMLMQSITSPHLTKAQQAEYEALNHTWSIPNSLPNATVEKSKPAPFLGAHKSPGAYTKSSTGKVSSVNYKVPR